MCKKWLKVCYIRDLEVILFAQRLGDEPPSELKESKIRTLPELATEELQQP